MKGGLPLCLGEMDSSSGMVYSQSDAEAWQLFSCTKRYKIYSYAATQTSGINSALFMSSQSFFPSMLLSSRWNSFLSLLWQITSPFCLPNRRTSFYVWAHFSYTWHIYLANLVMPEDVTHPDRCLLCQHSLNSKHGEFFLIYFSAELVD